MRKKEPKASLYLTQTGTLALAFGNPCFSLAGADLRRGGGRLSPGFPMLTLVNAWHSNLLHATGQRPKHWVCSAKRATTARFIGIRLLFVGTKAPFLLEGGRAQGGAKMRKGWLTPILRTRQPSAPTVHCRTR